MRTRVKICGVRSVEDALLAARAGADAVGVIQVTAAKRCIPVSSAADIARVLPAFVTPVLVFADTPIDDIVAVCKATAVRTVQLHGHEPVSVALALNARLGITVIKRLEVGLAFRAELDHWSLLDRNVLAGVVVEGPGRGGSGVETDWDALEWDLSQFDRTALPPLILAGGLTAFNVAAVVRRFRPHAVDTSSGVENPAEPLKKDPFRLKAFFEAVRQADTQDDPSPPSSPPPAAAPSASPHVPPARTPAPTPSAAPTSPNA